MADYSPVSTFLNPLAIAHASGRGVGVIARSAADEATQIAARGVATATAPAARAVGDVGKGLSETSRFLGISVETLGETAREYSEELDKLGNKVLIGETILVVGVLGLAAIAAWYFAESPKARRTAGTAAKTGAKMLAIKAATRGMG